MERKIGEEFKFKGHTYIVKEVHNNGCVNCALEEVNCFKKDCKDIRGRCIDRTDNKEVIFIRKECDICDETFYIKNVQGVFEEIQECVFCPKCGKVK